MSILDEWENPVKPPDADSYAWDRFVEYAIKSGIGGHPDDYDAWWECWKLGYIASHEVK